MSRAGAVFLWPVPLLTEDGRRNAWHRLIDTLDHPVLKRLRGE